MKELLYIPSGKYVRFPEKGGCSIEELVEYYKDLRHHDRDFESIERIVDNIIEHRLHWNSAVYNSAEIDRNFPILPCEFEIVDV